MNTLVRHLSLLVVTSLLAGCFVFVEAGFCTPSQTQTTKSYCSAEYFSPIPSQLIRNDQQATFVQKLCLLLFTVSTLLLVQHIQQVVSKCKKPDDRVLSRLGPYQKWYPALVPSEQ